MSRFRFLKEAPLRRTHDRPPGTTAPVGHQPHRSAPSHAGPSARSIVGMLLLPAAAAVALAGCGNLASGNAQTPRAAGPSPAASTNAGNGQLTVTTTEFAFAPMDVTVKAGKLKLTLVNNGKTAHEIVVLKTNQAAGALAVSGARVGEATSVGEVSETPAGATKSSTLSLKPGKYVFVCNIPGHYQSGMRGTLTVQ